MKTDIDIKDDIYKYLKDSKLASAVTGKISKTLRPPKSTKEDIVISVLANSNQQIQEAYVNVNIYVKDLFRESQYEENTIRLRELSKLASETLNSFIGKGYRFDLEQQRVMDVPGVNEHFINNKLLYKFSKE